MKMSPAMGVACVALFMSLAGNAAAVKVLITGKDVRDGSLELRDLSPSARQALRGQMGPQGPPGSSGSTAVLEAKMSALELRVSRMCPSWGRLVEDVRYSSYSGITVTYHSCRY